MAVATLSPEQEAAARRLAALELGKRDSSRLARLVTIRSDPPSPRDIPFDLYAYQRDRLDAWDGHQSNVILKARQLGMSWAMALYMLRRAAFDGWRIGYWSMNEDTSVYQLEGRVLRLHQSLPPEIRPRIRRRGTLLEFPDNGGGFIHVFPATQKAGTSYTFDLVVFDEFAMHGYGASNLGAVEPTISGGGQLIINSTADPGLGPNGAFYHVWTAAHDHQRTDVEDRDEDGGSVGVDLGAIVPVFLPWDIRPGRDAAWLADRRRRMAGLGEAEFHAAYPSTPEEAFMGRSGTVYPQFSRERHVRAVDPVPWEQCAYRFAGYDLGGGDPTAVVFLGAYRLPHAQGGGWRVHQYGEWYERKVPTVADMQDALAPWPGLDWISCDPKEPTMQATLHGLGYPAQLANWKREEGLGVVGDWLDSDWLTIAERCVESIREFPGYRWANRTDPHSKERYATSTPVDNHADAMDARRYAMVDAHYLLMREDDGRQEYAAVRW